MSVSRQMIINRDLEITPGLVPNVEDNVFQELRCFKHPGGCAVRLVFEDEQKDLSTITVIYEEYPRKLYLIALYIGFRVSQIEFMGTIENGSYKVTFKNGQLFTI